MIGSCLEAAPFEGLPSAANLIFASETQTLPYQYEVFGGVHLPSRDLIRPACRDEEASTSR